jgi:hypothetical protein
MENRANEAVEITLYKDMKLEKQVKAGTYTLYAIPEKESYTIIISKDLNVWDPTTTKKLMMLPD